MVYMYMVLQNNDRWFKGQKIYLLLNIEGIHQHLHFGPKKYNDVMRMYMSMLCVRHIEAI